MKHMLAFIPECGVASFEEYARCLRSAVCENKLFIDGVQIVRHFDHLHFTDQDVEWQRLDHRGALDEMRGRVDMRAGVRAEVEHRNVGAVARRQAAPDGKLHAWITGPGWQFVADGNGNVVN